MCVLEGKPIAAKRVKDFEFEAFMAEVAGQDARILSISPGRGGRRYKRWVMLNEECKESEVTDWPLNGARTAAWCLEYLVRMGQTIESHHEDFVRRCKLERNSWGVNSHWQSSNFLKCLGETDQCDLLNLVAAEAAFRELQTIEYSYLDKLKDLEGGGSSGSGRLTSEEQALFAGTSRMATSLMICPALLDQVKQEVDREGGLLKNLAKSREARAALRKK